MQPTTGYCENGHLPPLLMPIPFPQGSPEKPNTASSALPSSSQAIASTLASADNDIVGKTISLTLKIMLTIILQRMSSPPSVPMVSDLSNNIQSAVAFGGDGLIKQVSQLLDPINKELKKSSHPNAAQLSLSFLKLKDSLSWRLNVAGGIIVIKGNKVVFSLLQGIRTAHGYLLHFGSPGYPGEIRNPFYQGRGIDYKAEQLKEATELIVEASIMCCAQIKASILCCAHSILCCTHSNMEF